MCPQAFALLPCPWGSEKGSIFPVIFARATGELGFSLAGRETPIQQTRARVVSTKLGLDQTAVHLAGLPFPLQRRGPRWSRPGARAEKLSS